MGLTAEQLKASINALAGIEPAFAAALARAGYPEPRLRDRGYETLLRTIVGQQVSVAAAASIDVRLVHVGEADAIVAGITYAITQ